ncbi:HAD family hydrolase [Glacieibacterium megasporae]|uniref:HAD family hydrolase n=1 Tax=Glacieibacterium megasporae TaxID=2835787 RepID=UPI0021022CAC|nr:HAD family hydrolase [Polymorphobacter megasporae]
MRADKSLAEANIAAIAALRATGIEVSLISARPPSGMLQIAKKLGLTAPLASFNGGTLFQSDGTILSSAHLHATTAGCALARISRPGIDPWLFAGGRWYASTTAGPHVRRERLSAGIEPTIREDLTDLLDHVDKLVGVCDDPDELAKAEQELRSAIGTVATVARSQVYYLDVTASSANKGDGITAIAAACGVPLSAIAVIGDQYNDVPMFGRARLSIAMAQAPAGVRAAADFVTGSNDEDGVADAIHDIIAGRGMT